MTSPRRFETDLPALLAEMYVAGTPDYRDDLIRQTARVRQRPAWTFPERWLPVELTTARVPTTRMPWRQLGVLALLAILLAAAVAAYVGSQPRLPPPFGIAANGQVAYENGGDIFTIDPATGVATAIVTGPDNDASPVWSRDGTHIAFKRAPGASPSLYVVGREGKGLVALTPEPIDNLANYSFSPDGSQVLFTSGAQVAAELWIVKIDGSGLRRLDVGVGVGDPSFRPPDGAEIVFAGAPSAADNGLFAIDTTGGGLRTILGPDPAVGRGWARLSPDGSRIAYSASTQATDRNTYSVHVVGADGTGDMTIPLPPGATFQDAPAWSNDGTFLAVVRGYGMHNEEMTLAVVPADGSGVGVETERGLTGCCDTIFEWAPDDTAILVKPFDLNGRPLPPLLWDPRTGGTHAAPWATTSDPAWQRVVR